MSDKQLIRLTTEQLDRLITLQRRKVQLAEQRLRRMGVTTQEINAAKQGTGTTTMQNGATIEFEGDQYYLADHDDTGVTLRRVG